MAPRKTKKEKQHGGTDIGDGLEGTPETKELTPDSTFSFETAVAFTESDPTLPSEEDPKPSNGLIKIFISSKVADYENVKRGNTTVKMLYGSINGQRYKIQLDTAVEVSPDIAQVVDPLCKKTAELQIKEAV